jgi:hypothetical protein
VLVAEPINILNILIGDVANHQYLDIALFSGFMVRVSPLAIMFGQRPQLWATRMPL